MVVRGEHDHPTSTEAWPAHVVDLHSRVRVRLSAGREQPSTNRAEEQAQIPVVSRERR